MKFETYAHKIVPDHQLNFHKDPCEDARARGVNACTHHEMRARLRLVHAAHIWTNHGFFPYANWILNQLGLKLAFTTLQFNSCLNLCFFWNNIYLFSHALYFLLQALNYLKIFWLVASRALNFSCSSLCWTIVQLGPGPKPKLWTKAER